MHPSLFISGRGWGCRVYDNTCITKRFHVILLYPVSNQRAQHGWVQRKLFNIRVLRWPKKAILEVFVVNRVQNEYPTVFSQKGQFCPLLPPLAKSWGRRLPLPPCCWRPWCCALNHQEVQARLPLGGGELESLNRRLSKRFWKNSMII